MTGVSQHRGTITVGRHPMVADASPASQTCTGPRGPCEPLLACSRGVDECASAKVDGAWADAAVRRPSAPKDLVAAAANPPLRNADDESEEFDDERTNTQARRPWAQAVLREYLASRDPDYQLSPENSWIGRLSGQQARFLQELPYTLSLPSLNALVVHAGLVPGQGLATSPRNMVSMRNLLVRDPWEQGGILGVSNECEGSVPWGSLWNGPAHVYFGHDAKRMLQTWPRCTGLDTGCVYGNSLTGVFVTGPSAGKMVSVKALQMHKNPLKSEL
ncbi:conserved hypothetical protein [Ixodes scapularis]|uniref:Uncharacterized protein n=1 Tax=Ixodes scapularis TaxID=6945 RepID=B7QLS3_IXOSC|nr:conserved hypothetical protein [Ixodes scapularis]|eukprot:XP_002416128.1 conserved hypothetical protein [Ixodes scapularis]